MADRNETRSSDEIRRDIEGTRADLHETVDALERKLSVGQIVDEVWGRVAGDRSPGSVASSVGDVIRDHPVPLALMGLGVAWLAVDKATGSSQSVGPGTYGRAPGRRGPYLPDAIDYDDSSTLDSIKDKAGSLADKASDAASSLKDRAVGAAGAVKRKAGDLVPDGSSGDSRDDWSTHEEGSDLRHRASHVADRARSEASHRARQAKSGFWSAMDEQPLALGAVAFGLGLASGLSVPTTHLEDELMGRAAEGVKDEVAAAAKSAGRSAKNVAKDTVDAAKAEADRQAHGVADDLKESGKRVAAAAKETAKQRAHEEDLDAEGMKDRAARTGQRAQQRAKE